jgi:hypothetical protein
MTGAPDEMAGDLRLPEHRPASGWAGSRPALIVSVGMAAALVALVDGISMIVKRHVTDCPDGKYFGPDETDFTCYAYPLAHQGVAVVAFAVLFAVLVGLAGAVLAVVTRLDLAAGGSEPTAPHIRP